MAEKRKGIKRKIVLNPDEPDVGNAAVAEYNKYHPLHGTVEDIAHMRQELRGLRNHDVKVTFTYSRPDREGEEKRHRVSETMRYNNYNDIFGTDGLYASAMHAQLDADSDEELVFYSVEIEDYG